MNGAAPGPDVLVAATAAAVTAARRAGRSLREEAIPALPPQRRVFAAHVLRHLERNTYLDRKVLEDIETFLDVLRREIAKGTLQGWEADEHHTRGGWETRHLNEHASALLRPVRFLERLQEEIAHTLDMAHALRLAETLLED